MKTVLTLSEPLPIRRTAHDAGKLAKRLRHQVGRAIADFGMIEAGDQETYVFRHDGVEISRNGKSLGRIEAPDFSRLLLSTWIGATPTTAALKRDLLGR